MPSHRSPSSRPRWEILPAPLTPVVCKCTSPLQHPAFFEHLEHVLREHLETECARDHESLLFGPEPAALAQSTAILVSEFLRDRPWEPTRAPSDGNRHPSSEEEDVEPNLEPYPWLKDPIISEDRYNQGRRHAAIFAQGLLHDRSLLSIEDGLGRAALYWGDRVSAPGRQNSDYARGSTEWFGEALMLSSEKEEAEAIELLWMHIRRA
jgi:hypothetical protein